MLAHDFPCWISVSLLAGSWFPCLLALGFPSDPRFSCCWLLDVLITIDADLASSPEVGSSINIMEGLETNSTAIVSRLRCSVDKPFTPGRPTTVSLIDVNSTSSIISSMNICNYH
ncbi:hypothetical protein IEQ34_002805 [Dendrobium chrysotoxum]|uniref:Secreted protein n=1 Tax=Dendrobium chrysotoxum TaxID=161865 RepID=A0AAV7HFV8_DENCH|nr:hypothetical protein IEQ34_002805 [Dendrobium chrysotoxum]